MHWIFKMIYLPIWRENRKVWGKTCVFKILLVVCFEEICYYLCTNKNRRSSIVSNTEMRQRGYTKHWKYKISMMVAWAKYKLTLTFQWIFVNSRFSLFEKSSKSSVDLIYNIYIPNSSCLMKKFSNIVVVLFCRERYLPCVMKKQVDRDERKWIGVGEH